MMINLITILSISLLKQLQESLYSLNPAVLEIGKVVLVSIVWIGGLAWFMYRKDKRKQNSIA